MHQSKKQVNSFLKRDKLKRVKSSDFEFGAIIGLADIESISIYGREHEGKPHAYGTYCWKMTNARFLQNPIPMLGQLGLRHLSDELASNVLSQETIQVPPDSPIRIMLLDNMEAPPNPLDQYEYCIRYLDEKETGKMTLSFEESMKTVENLIPIPKSTRRRITIRMTLKFIINILPFIFIPYPRNFWSWATQKSDGIQKSSFRIRSGCPRNLKGTSASSKP